MSKIFGQCKVTHIHFLLRKYSLLIIQESKIPVRNVSQRIHNFYITVWVKTVYNWSHFTLYPHPKNSQNSPIHFSMVCVWITPEFLSENFPQQLYRKPEIHFPSHLKKNIKLEAKNTFRAIPFHVLFYLFHPTPECTISDNNSHRLPQSFG